MPRAQSGFNWDVYQHIRLRPGEDVSGAVFVSGQSALYHQDTVEDIRQHRDNKALFFPEASVLTFPRIGIVVPLKNDGRTIGTLYQSQQQSYYPTRSPHPGTPGRAGCFGD